MTIITEKAMSMQVLPRVQYKSHLFLRFEKKDKSVHRREKVEQKQYWNWENQIQDPIFPCV